MPELTPEFKSILSSVVNKDELVSLLAYLKSRWSNENVYEAFQEYEESMKNVLKELFPEIKFIKGVKRPFGMIIEINGQEVKVFTKVKGRYINLAAKLA